MIRVENKHFVLTVGTDCMPRSLIHKATNQECLEPVQELALFSITQLRPYNNEIKLAYPTQKTTFQGNRLRREGDKLIIGFELIPYEAVVSVRETDEYISFRLEDFIEHPGDYSAHISAFLGGNPPPLDSFRLLQLPVRDRENFGHWLNVTWDTDVAVNVLATSQYAAIDAEKRGNTRIMYADAIPSVRLRGTEAAIIATETDKLLDAIDTLERDYDLPRGVESRRGNKMRTSSYWASKIHPGNVDEYIRRCKQCGYGMMTIYANAIYKSIGYELYGDYEYADTYPEGAESLRKMLRKIKDAGIIPGFHFLHPHIGVQSRYVTPVADHRLHLTRHFTLSRPLDLEADTVYVEQCPVDCPTGENYRVLQFGGELIHYSGFTTERPYCFTGCKRGHLNTYVVEHPRGQIGGILDISEYCGVSVYLDQETDLQDEVSAKLAEAYALGFEYLYFDGSEGTNAPFAYHVANAQYRTWKLMQPAPIYCEGAAKSHFSWHMISGGNAFDVFRPALYKEMIRRHPADEAPRMARDFTRLNFGWWNFYPDLQPDHWEYGSSLAAAWDCPATIFGDLAPMEKVPRLDDLLEVIRRWEDVRVNQLLTLEQKRMLRENQQQEHILLINEDKEYELVPYRQLKTGDDNLRAFLFERKDLRWVVFWHTTGAGEMVLNIPDAQVRNELWEAPLTGNAVPVSRRRYLSTALTAEEVEGAFANLTLM